MKTKLFTLLLALLLNTLALADDKKDTNKANELLDLVRKDLTSLSADFQQYELDVNGNVSETSTGKVWLNAPNQFKWNYIKPMPQLIMANGETIWIYDEDLEQVTVKKQRNKQNPIYVLLNKEETQKYYSLVLKDKVKDDASKIQWIEMIPNNSSEEVKTVLIGIENANLVRLKIINQLGNTVVFSFANIERNPKLKDGSFTFNIPKGTDVISDMPQAGEF